jgi:membrane protease YdiL (CAAX protease family)
MRTITAFIKKHAVLTYYALAFAISWGGIIIVVGPGEVTGTTKPPDVLLPFVYLAMLAGPSVASLLLTGLVDGKAGFRELVSRLLKWRVGARWYAALLTAPLLMTAIPFALSLISPVFLPGIITTDDKASFLLVGIVAGLLVGFFEELGWTGFAVPRLTLGQGVLATGLIVGLLHGAWHFPVFSGAGSSGALSPALVLPVQLFSFLPAFRVLMVWVYDRTRSLLVAMLMHVSLTASTLIFQPVTTGAPLVIYDLVLGAALWVIVAAVAAAYGGQLSQQPLRRRAA